MLRTIMRSKVKKKFLYARHFRVISILRNTKKNKMYGNGLTFELHSKVFHRRKP